MKPGDRFPDIADQFKRANDGARFLYVAKDGKAADVAVRELARLTGGVAHFSTRKVTLGADKVFRVSSFSEDTRGIEPTMYWIDEAASLDKEAVQRLGAHAGR